MSEPTQHRVAFATHAGAPEITADDQLLADALAVDGVEVRGVPWDASVDWTRYDAVILRSTWDFHRRLPEFTRWLRRLEAESVPLVNPSRVIGWNLTKRYLQELETLGTTIVPTHWITPSAEGMDTSLLAIASALRWDDGIVVKPVVSASAHDTWVARGVDRGAEDARLRHSLARSSHGLMLQPFLPEIATQGEWSLIFIAGSYSHAVLKRPAAGDFRVQNEYGGSAEPAEPPTALIDDATRAVRAAARATDHQPHDILYARVDGVELAGRLMLMELEAVEPVLFLRTAPTAAQCMSAALAHLFASRPAVAGGRS